MSKNENEYKDYEDFNYDNIKNAIKNYINGREYENEDENEDENEVNKNQDDDDDEKKKKYSVYIDKKYVEKEEESIEDD